MQQKFRCETCSRNVCKACSEICHEKHLVIDMKKDGKDELFACECMTDCVPSFPKEILTKEKTCLQNCINLIDSKNTTKQNRFVTCECSPGILICLYCALYCHKKFKKCKGLQYDLYKGKGNACACKTELGSSCFGVSNHYQMQN